VIDVYFLMLQLIIEMTILAMKRFM
jgi:hypothetical protein